jgi:hypothetical protein
LRSLQQRECRSACSSAEAIRSRTAKAVGLWLGSGSSMSLTTPRMGTRADSTGTVGESLMASDARCASQVCKVAVSFGKGAFA